MSDRKRIAIYGGTFDPIHSGHLEVARSVSQLFGIDEFLFVPARVAPHKSNRQVSSPLDRYAMLVLATERDRRLCVSRFELEGPERQYTVDTLSYFQTLHGETAELFFVLGADSWSEIEAWREWRRLTTLANLIVVTRPGFNISTAAAGLNEVGQIVDLRGTSGDELSKMVQAGEKKIFITDVVMRDVSATEVRRAARKESRELEKLVPPEVAEYIRKYGLYRNTNEA
jgi:nicotinate-nucleotide adenylyltransferase